ncbi:MAG: GNAT family N-acetyltransferase [Arenibacterium sp.]
MIPPLTEAEQSLETDRLRITPLTLADTDIALELLTDIRVMRYVTGEAETPEQVHAHMPDAVRKGAGGRIGIWTVSLKETGEKIGDTVILPLPVETEDTEWKTIVPDRYPDASIETGYLLKPAHWGKGYATEICARMLRFGFENTTLDAIYATTDPDNAASQNVLRKCGLVYLGERRAYASDDVSWFRITRAEWETRRDA